MKYILAAAALPAALALAGTAQAQLLDGSFEFQAPDFTGGTTGYCYFGGAGPNPACATGPWTGSSGLQDQNNTAFPGIATPAGDKYGFVQNGGNLSQTFTADQTGSFVLNWLDAGRPVNGGVDGDETYEVTLGSFDLGTFSTASGVGFNAQQSAGRFSLVAGTSYTLTFQGLTGTDSTAYIDGVSLAAIPEPATWAFMILGLGAAGGAMRQRKAKVAVRYA